MSAGIRRRFADLSCRALQSVLPLPLQPWGRAIRCETAGIANDTKALLFALDSVRGLLPRALAIHLSKLFVAPACGGLLSMRFYTGAMRRPRAVGIACAIGAVVLGLAYMAIAGAPLRYLAINSGALIVGLALLLLCGRARDANVKDINWPGQILGMSVVLLVTTLLGQSAEGATRWLLLGGLAVQPSLVLLPVMIVTFARSRNLLGTVGILVAAGVLAWQPDRAMAGMLAAGLTALALVRPDRFVVGALSLSVAGFGATLTRPDSLPASPYVDQILYSAFDVHILAGVAVLAGALLLLVPAILGWRYDAARTEIYLVFGVTWLAAIAAAALGNYPTPMVGYGGSAIIGYALSLVALPKRTTAHSQAPGQSSSPADAHPQDRHLRLELA
ncbi:hypothetical protein HNP52_004592 [Sphingomonas kyeonggiensis]|uniref:Cell wall polymerase n=1 Tax=Sphingomonas kyeonggiensis TaxID=1268553 RepID=A0A7W7NU12_9SPHN|nr:hypothetical protein [Sphingomonas kyeonggiensis]MBB4841488.1 hypothetical protein [Sphingomonas kyeonggiensis]